MLVENEGGLRQGETNDIELIKNHLGASVEKHPACLSLQFACLNAMSQFLLY
jgi:hypothetical protein